SCMQPTYRTVTVAWWSWPPSSGCTRFCSSFTPTAAIRGRSSRRVAPRLPPRPGGDRQAVRSGQGLRGPAEALDCRTHHSLAEPLPSAGQGLGVPQPQGSRLPALGFHSPYAPKALPHNKMIPDRLSGVPYTIEVVERLAQRNPTVLKGGF